MESFVSLNLTNNILNLIVGEHEFYKYLWC